MNYKYKSVIVKAGKTYERDHETEQQARSWLAANLYCRKRITVAKVLRAETEGINEGCYFLVYLHHIR